MYNLYNTPTFLCSFNTYLELGICLKHKISGGASLLNKFVARLALTLYWRSERRHIQVMTIEICDIYI